MARHDVPKQPGVHSTEPTECTSLLGVNERRKGQTGLGSECWHLIRAAAPISGGYLLQNSIQLASITIIGRLGSLELSVVASGFMIATCTGWLLAVGGTTALDALGPRALANGAGGDALSTLFWKCLFLLTVLYAPVVLLWSFMGPILIAVGQSAELAHGTQTFLRALAPSGLGYVYFETLKKFLQCLGHRNPGAITLLFVAVLNVPVCWLAVHRFELGLVGGVFATGCMYWLALIILSSYTIFHRAKLQLHKPSADMFSGIWPVAKLVLLGIAIVGAEWWGFELIAIAAGVMGDTAIATQSIVMTVDTVFALIPFGLGVASTNRVAHFLGSKEHRNARVAARASSLLAICNGFFTMTMIMTLRGHLARAFSTDAEVIGFAIAIFPWGAAFQVFDSLQAANSGCLRGMGRADIAAVFNLVAYYIIAIPLGMLIGFTFNWGLHGLWFGLALALFIVGFGECATVNLAPWSKIVSMEDVVQAEV